MLYLAYCYLGFVYYQMNDADQAAYSTVQSIILLKEVMIDYPIQSKQDYITRISFARKVYIPSVHTYNMEQLWLLISEYDAKHRPTKTVSEAPDKV